MNWLESFLMFRLAYSSNLSVSLWCWKVVQKGFPHVKSSMLRMSNSSWTTGAADKISLFIKWYNNSFNESGISPFDICVLNSICWGWDELYGRFSLFNLTSLPWNIDPHDSKLVADIFGNIISWVIKVFHFSCWVIITFYYIHWIIITFN